MGKKRVFRLGFSQCGEARAPASKFESSVFSAQQSAIEQGYRTISCTSPQRPRAPSSALGRSTCLDIGDIFPGAYRIALRCPSGSGSGLQLADDICSDQLPKHVIPSKL